MLVLEKRPHKCAHADVPMSLCTPPPSWNCHAGECARPIEKPYGPFQPAVSVLQSYGKMVPPTTPYGKTIPPSSLGWRHRVGVTPVHTTAIMDCHSGECAWPMAEPYGPFQPAVSRKQSYGKMVPPTTPYGKTIPPSSLNSSPFCTVSHATRSSPLSCAAGGRAFAAGRPPASNFRLWTTDRRRANLRWRGPRSDFG